MWARIENQAVVEVTDVDPKDRFHPSLVWVACPKGTRPGMQYIDGAFIEAPVGLPDYAAQIAAVRYQHETAGIAVGGISIDTGRDSQALITGATLSAVIDPEYVCTWKTVNGPVELKAAQLIGIAAAVRSHVQACFNRECELLMALADGTFEDDMLGEGWPA